MPFNDLVHWYQKKIGTYDKQQWEKTVEQRILGGFTNVPMRTAKLKTELIDVDLVRGSSFPKAKPKHGLSTVVWLAIQRLLFLPFFCSWWTQQTSPRVFRLFLLLYGLQLFNVCTYFYSSNLEQPDSQPIVSPGEVLMPLGMMFVLCMVHSQIVSTNSGPSTTTAHSRSRVRRSRHERSRSGKLRPRRNLRTNETKTPHESATERTIKTQINVSPSVRFAKKVSIDNSSPLGKVQLEVESPVQSVPEQDTSKSDSPASSPEVAIAPQIEPLDIRDVLGEIEDGNPVNPDIVHQDDDGFESLNGNVSSDNDRNIPRPEVRRRLGLKTIDPENSFLEERSGEASRIVKHEEGNTWHNPEGSCKSPPPLPKAGSIDDMFETIRHRRFLANVHDKETKQRLERNSQTLNLSTVSPSLGDVELDLDRKGPASNPLATEEPIKIIPREGKQECESEEEGECEEAAMNHLTEATTSATEWMGVTTNSDVCSCSSDLEESDARSESNISYADFVEHPFSWDLELPPSIFLGSNCTSSDRVSCTIWTRRDIKKAELSVLDISSAIIARVESMPDGMDYFYVGLSLSLMLSLIPSMKRLSDEFGNESTGNLTGATMNDLTQITLESCSVHLCNIIDVAFGSTLWERVVVLTLAFEKLSLSCLLFFLLAVAERTFKQRLLYAKLFSHLTSSRRARKSDLPHFRLNKVRNIKTWLSVRSYLKRRGPQRSVDVIVSAAFIVTLLLLSFVSLELIKDLENLHLRYNVEALLWSFALGIYILRFMTLGTKINKKYRNLSILITEQINLYLQIEQKPHKKEELMVANSVLKLAADLIKELECPFKISGLSANPYLYTITKVVLLSALSGVLSELLGFKLKLHKITIK